MRLPQRILRGMQSLAGDFLLLYILALLKEGWILCQVLDLLLYHHFHSFVRCLAFISAHRSIFDIAGNMISLLLTCVFLLHWRLSRNCVVSLARLFPFQERLLEIKQLLLESWVWIDNWSSLPCVKQSVLQRHAKLLHHVGNYHRSTS